MNRRDVVQGFLLFLVTVALIYLVLWGTCQQGAATIAPVGKTAQQCADDYRAMRRNAQGLWTSSEAFIDECVQ